MTDAFGRLLMISSSAFIAAFQVIRCMFEYAIDLSKLPQGSTQDVLQEVRSHSGIFNDIGQNADVEYSEIYKMTEHMVSISRRFGRQTVRHNVEAATLEIH